MKQIPGIYSNGKLKTWGQFWTPTLDGITLVQQSLSTSKVFRKVYRAPFPLRLSIAFRLFVRAHDTVVIAPYANSLAPALDFNVDRAIKLLHITPALLLSSDSHSSRQTSYDELTSDELRSLIAWTVTHAGRPQSQLGYNKPEARRG